MREFDSLCSSNLVFLWSLLHSFSLWQVFIVTVHCIPALMCSQVENVLDKYKDGTFVAKAFTEKGYGTRYEQNSTDLRNWADTKPDFVEKW